MYHVSTLRCCKGSISDIWSQRNHNLRDLKIKSDQDIQVITTRCLRSPIIYYSILPFLKLTKIRNRIDFSKLIILCFCSFPWSSMYIKSKYLDSSSCQLNHRLTPLLKWQPQHFSTFQPLYKLQAKYLGCLFKSPNDVKICKSLRFT